MKRQVIVFTCALAIGLMGCTQVTVKPAENRDAAYYLPQTFIYITPQENGSLDVRTESIADRSQGYAVSATSYLAYHKLIVKQVHGLLSEVSITRDSSAVAAESVKAAGAIEAAKIDAKVAKESKLIEKQQAKEKSQEDAVNKIKDALAQAEIELAQAKATYKVNSSNDNKIALEKAQAKVDELKNQLEQAKQNGSFSQLDKTKILRPGPIILRIVEDGDVLQLIPVNFDTKSQEEFESYQIPEPDEEKEPAKAPSKIEFEQSDLGKISLKDKTAIISTKIEFQDKDFKIVEMSREHGGKVSNHLFPNLKQKNSKTFELTFRPETPPDKYKLTFRSSIKGSTKFIHGTLTINLVP